MVSASEENCKIWYGFVSVGASAGMAHELP